MNTAAAKPISVEFGSQYEFIKAYCIRKFGTVSPGVLLFEMIVKGENDAEYGKKLRRWFSRGSTLILRELTEGFGSYFGDLEFANTVDGIDSGRAALR